MTTTTSRRAVLAGIAAAPALAAPALALSGPDPIFAAIEAHKRAYAATDQILDRRNELEEVIPQDKREWSWNVGELNAPADCTDDPQWLANEKQAELSGRAQDRALLGLLTIRATTTAGLAALLRYVYEFRESGDDWVDLMWDADGNLITRHLLATAGPLGEEEDSAHDFDIELCRVVADALKAIGGAA